MITRHLRVTAESHIILNVKESRQNGTVDKWGYWRFQDEPSDAVRPLDYEPVIGKGALKILETKARQEAYKRLEEAKPYALALNDWLKDHEDYNEVRQHVLDWAHRCHRGHWLLEDIENQVQSIRDPDLKDELELVLEGVLSRMEANIDLVEC